MPKCSKCGKRFQTLSSLQDHYRGVHPNERFVAPKTTVARNLILGLVIVIILVGALVGYLIYLQEQQGGTIGAQSGLLGQPIPSELYQNLSGVSFTTLSSIGSGQGVTPPQSVSGSPMTVGGKPEVLYIGAEFCPYCAAERWSLVVALSKFGNFTGLSYMRSASNDGNVATLTFYGSTYTSQYFIFVPVEQEDRNHQPLQTVSQSEQQIWYQYESNGGYPFVDIGGGYVVTGAQYPFGDLSGFNWTQIASELNNPNSSVAKAIDGTANTLISAICKIDGGSPSSVCSQSFADLPLAFTVPRAASSSFASSLQISSELVSSPRRLDFEMGQGYR